MTISGLSEQEIVRREKKDALEGMGIDPYPSRSFEVDFFAKNAEDSYAEAKVVSMAGRIMSRRVMGSASFLDLQDSTGKIQLYVHRDSICPSDDKKFYNEVFKKLLDIGDIIGVKGFLFKTKVGEISVHVEHFELLSKALKPLPIVKEAEDDHGKKHFDAFTDVEQRHRQRYVDLVVNPDVKDIFIKRAKIIDYIRKYFNGLGCLEVETPILQPLYGGALARPFKTFHNTLKTTLYLRIANELYLKRLIVGGFDGVYEFAKDFRNEGMSRFHNPEFTMLEVYLTYKDYLWMMDKFEELMEGLAIHLHGDTKVMINDKVIDFKRPWKRLTIFEAIKNFTGIDISKSDTSDLRKIAADLNIELEESAGKGKIIDEIFSYQCEPHLIQPTFILDYPIEMSPLAKRHRSAPDLVERFEVICNGKELCNAFSELNDPVDQRKRFEEQLDLGRQGDEEAMILDEDFLRALSYGMPPTVGLGLGIDRLTMIMTNSNSIQEVILFPQMRPENHRKNPTP
jgi:lysyl-tRNA synthetase class 2